MTLLLDNKGQGKVGDALAEGIHANAHVSILSSLFSIYGYSALKKQLERADALRLLIPSNDTLVWGKLYRFQHDGVLGAIDKMEKYNGCIIADSVGLGKKFEALAIIKYYDMAGFVESD